MEQGRLVLLLVLACACKECMCQHWSYGWLPGGKRSIGGELEATFRMMDDGDTLIPLTAEKLQSNDAIIDNIEENAVRRGRRPLRRELLD
ncbi:gonadotropin-releasing hormone 3 [Engraulis encrasicolus]|uniref:gonadotropin-releasing hormone 3 n=1 Tax=Engraulis encrasicolus TaxID=184585 RepID=UPI002FD36DD0